MSAKKLSYPFSLLGNGHGPTLEIPSTSLTEHKFYCRRIDPPQ